MPLCFSVQDLNINEKVDVIVSEWMGYMLLYEVTFLVLWMGLRDRNSWGIDTLAIQAASVVGVGRLPLALLDVIIFYVKTCGGTICR